MIGQYLLNINKNTIIFILQNILEVNRQRTRLVFMIKQARAWHPPIRLPGSPILVYSFHLRNQAKLQAGAGASAHIGVGHEV